MSGTSSAFAGLLAMLVPIGADGSFTTLHHFTALRATRTDRCCAKATGASWG
jgi:hypothetical protein